MRCPSQSGIETTERFFDNWFDRIGAVYRKRAREFLRMILKPNWQRGRVSTLVQDARSDRFGAVDGLFRRHYHRSRSLLDPFGRLEIAMLAPFWTSRL
jgi:hypothetical protein